MFAKGIQNNNKGQINISTLSFTSFHSNNRTSNHCSGQKSNESESRMLLHLPCCLLLLLVHVRHKNLGGSHSYCKQHQQHQQQQRYQQHHQQRRRQQCVHMCMYLCTYLFIFHSIIILNKWTLQVMAADVAPRLQLAITYAVVAMLRATSKWLMWEEAMRSRPPITHHLLSVRQQRPEVHK